MLLRDLHTDFLSPTPSLCAIGPVLLSVSHHAAAQCRRRQVAAALGKLHIRDFREASTQRSGWPGMWYDLFAAGIACR